MITLEQLKSVLVKPSFQSLTFDIPDSFTGMKREATFIEMVYYTADNQESKELRETTKFLKIKFLVRYFIEIEKTVPKQEEQSPIEGGEGQEPPEGNLVEFEDEEEIEYETIIEKYEIVNNMHYDEFTADYKTYVNALNGSIISYPKNNSFDLDTVLNFVNEKISKGEITEQAFLNGELPIVNQIEYFEMLFNNEQYQGMIPVKQLIQSFAVNAEWSDVEAKKI